MEYHAGGKDLLIEPLSLEELITTDKNESFFKGYCIFLDEFVGNVEIVLIRNLARVIGIRCIVANTNAVISNLTGKNQSQMSRESGNFDVWSIVLVRLNPVSRKVMKNIFNIEELKGELLSRCCESERAQMEYFIAALTGELGSISIVRSGLVSFVIDAIKQTIHYNRVIDMRTLIENIVKDVYVKLSKVKGQICGSIDGIMANLGLLTFHAYINDDEEDDDDYLFHQKSFLADHLYYLINPVQSENFLFLTYPPSKFNVRLEFWTGDNQRFQEWRHEYTCFRYDDILTILSCFSMKSSESIINNLSKAISINEAAATSVPNYANPLAKKLDGNQLEVLAALTIIDSSHFHYDEVSALTKFSLAGQNGINFINNILLNCILTGSHRKTVIKLKFSNAYVNNYDFDIEEFLRSLSVPFLCPFNSPIPEFLGNLIFDNITEGSIHFGTYSRTQDRLRIDAVFDVYYNQNQGVAIVECKNWYVSVSSSEIEKILSNALELNVQKRKISLFIFCNSVTSPEKSHEPLLNLCNEKRILIYRFHKELKSFTLIPFHHKEMSFDTLNPELVCFLFELKEINKNKTPKILKQKYK